MANTLVHVTGFPHNSVVSERYLLMISDGKTLASAVLVYDEIADEDDIEIKFGDEEPFKVNSYDDASFEEALSLMRERFGDITEVVNMTFGQAKAARLI